jgi:predicted DNA-binding ribbon-helix-helix protein
VNLIRADEHVDDLVQRFPELSAFLRRRGVICVQCGEVFWGTLSELIESKGLDTSEIVREINDEFHPASGFKNSL